jgi:anti-anti-sigma regulatory factor
VSKNDDKSRVLGDDPLAWLSAGTGIDKKVVKNPEKELEKKTDVHQPTTKNNKKAQPKKKSKIVQPKKIEPPKVNVEQARVKVEEKSNRLVLESSLVINKASDFYESLKKLSASGQAIEIDASKVEIIDSAILQLLFAFVLSLKANGTSLSWYKPSEGILNKASILGLTEHLGL